MHFLKINVTRRKNFLSALAAVLILTYAGLAFAGGVHVNGYFRSNGTYVQPHYRSAPDGNPYNNWSFPGNVNPYTGKVAPGNPETYLEHYYNRSGNASLPALPTLAVPPSTITETDLPAFPSQSSSLPTGQITAPPVRDSAALPSTTPGQMNPRKKSYSSDYEALSDLFN